MPAPFFGLDRLPPVHVEALGGHELSVPLREPFVIASGRMERTRAVLVQAVLRDAHRAVIAEGLGEAAALPPVTREDQPELLQAVAAAGERLRGQRLTSLSALTDALDALFPDRPVARAGVECALLDAWARLCGGPLCVLLGGRLPCLLHTDITLPICAPEHLAELARAYRARGFSSFKLKVGKRLDDDVRALAALAGAVPHAGVRLDANAGFDSEQALALCRRAGTLDLQLQCFEQPCAASDLEALARVAREAGVPVIADESCKTLADLDALLGARAAQGVNLKLVKHGGALRALELGRAAQRAGLSVMCGAMVETRLGLTAMAHVACALGGADYVDLDTAFLLARDPFSGGYQDRGEEILLTGGPGLDVRERQLEPAGLSG